MERQLMKNMIALILPVLILMSACISQEPSDIRLHTDECAYCKMVIADERFPAQLVSEKGKPYPFDSIECLAAYTDQNPDIAGDAKLYVTDFTQPGTWLLIDEADIYQSEEIQSPMGLSLFAVSEEAALPAMIENANLQEWQKTKEYVITSWNRKP